MGRRWTISGAGSSPLARGLRRSWRGEAESVGIIPARAGFTPAPHARRGRTTDHPRSRGVYAYGEFPYGHGGGSSPLARGLQHYSLTPRLRLWIIPARAGFTDNPTDFQVYGKDHPRSRGVYCFGFGFGIKAEGSSPLARGLPRRGLFRFLRSRIIPARAGFTQIASLTIDATLDHPRSRGVYT